MTDVAKKGRAAQGVMDNLKRLAGFREFIMVVVILLLCTGMFIATPIFLTPLNFEGIILGLSVEGIITIGMVILLACGGLDLSVGSTFAFTGVVTGLCLNTGIPVALSVLIGLFAAMCAGLVNGLLIAKVGLNPFITTFGMATALRGLVLIFAKGTAVLGLGDEFKAIGQSKLLGLQIPIYVLLILTILGDLALRNLRYMRQAYYIGSNENAARLSGIKVDRVKIFCYVLIALLAGISGILVTARFGTASVTIGQGMEMKVLTACIIGGCSMSGGEGSVLGGFLGALFMGLLANSLNLLGVDIYWQNFITGAILVIAIVLDKFNESRKLVVRKT